MNIRKSIKTFLQKRAVSADRWILDYLGRSNPTNAGVSVDNDTALNFIAVYSCINILSRTVGSLPLILYKRTKNQGKERATKHPLYNLLKYSPNPDQSQYRYMATVMAHLASYGNSYSLIERNNAGRIVGLWNLLPQNVSLERKNSRYIYKYATDTGQIEYDQDRILHIPLWSYDGILGLSPLDLAKEAIGLGLAVETYGAKFFGSGTNPSMIVEYPQPLESKNRKALYDGLVAQHAGLQNANGLMLLENGMKATNISIPPEAAQFLATRRFNQNQICALYLIPPHMLADLSDATFSNIEQQSLSFYMNTIRPYLTLIEQELSRRLLRLDEREDYFIEFLMDGVLRGDSVSRASFYKEQFMIGALSQNEIRAAENRNPITGGDKYFVPLNMVDSNAPAPEAPLYNDGTPPDKAKQ